MNEFSLIPLYKNGRMVSCTKVDASDVVVLSKMKWKLHSKGYAHSNGLANGYNRVVLMHRLIVGAPEDRQVDHINGDKLDNRKTNLRLATPSQNNVNSKRRRTATCKYRGVQKNSSSEKWQAKIAYHYKRIYIGSFDTAEQAALAYDVKAREIFGQFARTNFQAMETE